MKKIVSLLGVGICLCGIMLGCGNSKAKVDDKQKELVVFAAASMSETLKELGDKYMAGNKAVKIVYNFDSSGTLKTQIQEGAKCDVFISAGQKQMNGLDIKAEKRFNPKGLDFVLENSRFNILENKVALVVSKGNSHNIKSFEDLFSKLKNDKVMLAIGNSDVPVGQYSLKIFDYFKVDDKTLAKAGKITYGSNVKEVTTQVREGVVDAGIVYQTDAASAKLTVVDTATKAMCGQVIYPAAIMKTSKDQLEAKKYLDFLKTEDAGKVFKKVGFTPMK